MKPTLMLLCVLQGTCFANLKILTQYEIQGNSPRTSTIILQEKDLVADHWAEVSSYAGSSHFSMRVNAIRKGDDTVDLLFELQRTQTGKPVVLVKPTISTRIGTPAEVAVKDDDGTLLYRLRVTPTIFR